MVTTRGTLIAGFEGDFEKPTNSLLATLTLKGHLDIGTFRHFVFQNIVQHKEQNESLQYPELRQRLTSWCGFLFWEDDPNFSIYNHVVLHHPDPITCGSLNEHDLQVFKYLKF